MDLKEFLTNTKHLIEKIQSKHALFIFDACFAGTIFEMRSEEEVEAINYKTEEQVRQFITSGTGDEQVPDKNIFCQQFITAITTNYADINRDNYLTGTELGEFLQKSVISYSNRTQHPQYGKIRNPRLDKGDFVFVLSRENYYSNSKKENYHVNLNDGSPSGRKTDNILWNNDKDGYFIDRSSNITSGLLQVRPSSPERTRQILPAFGYFSPGNVTWSSPA